MFAGLPSAANIENIKIVNKIFRVQYDNRVIFVKYIHYNEL